MSIPIINYSTFLPTSNPPSGETAPFIRSSMANHPLKDHTSFTSKNSVYELLLTHIQNRPNEKFIGKRTQLSEKEYGDYTWKTYAEISVLVDQFLAGLVKLDLCPEKFIKENNRNFRILGIGSKNREEWLIAMIACMKGSITYTGLGSYDVTEHFLNESEMPTIVAETKDLEKLLKMKKNKQIESLRNLILFRQWADDDIVKKFKEDYKEVGINLICYEELLKTGQDYINELKEKNETLESKLPPLSLDTIVSMVYTSGTTGIPKGAMHTNRSQMSFIAAEATKLPQLSTNDLYYSSCPLTHELEAIYLMQMFYFGVPIGLSLNILEFEKDCTLLNPTITVLVPRIGERAMDKIDKVVATFSDAKKKFYADAYKTKLYLFNKYNKTENYVLDKLIFNEIKHKIFGKRMRLVEFCGADTRREIYEKFKFVLQVRTNNLYGLTETSQIFGTDPYDHDLVGIGGPLPQCQSKIVDVPELGFTTKDKDENGVPTPRGELAIKAASLLVGYFKIDKPHLKDGWFYTGDIVKMHTNKGNKIQIIDRKYNVFKLNIGEFVSINKIENILSKSEYVNQICVAGRNDRNYLVGILTVNKEKCLEFLKDKMDVNEKNLAEHYKDKILKTEILKDLDKVGRSNGLFGYEIVKDLFIFDGDFEKVKGLTTETCKLKNKQINEYFKKEIAAMYDK